ncbi:conjugal transfer protein TraI, partial [Bradyrhizobium sp. CNPSo 4026]|nr:conjugal transfer protein TraI [Bradyrhizobium cenepequi]
MTDRLDQDPPEPLELRTRPRPIRRLNRRALMIGCAVAALFIAGATIVALRPPRLFKGEERAELYNTERKQTAEGFNKLPKSYEDVPPSVPRLGPPSPGDVGRAFAENEKKAGVAGASEAGFRTNPEEDAERAERIRQARIAQQAKESGLFFRLSEKQEKRKQASTADVAANPASAFRPPAADASSSAAELAQTTRAMVDRSGEI